MPPDKAHLKEAPKLTPLELEAWRCYVDLSASRQYVWAEFPVGKKGAMGYGPRPQPLLWADIKAYADMIRIPSYRMRNWISWVQILDAEHCAEANNQSSKNLDKQDKETL